MPFKNPFEASNGIPPLLNGRTVAWQNLMSVGEPNGFNEYASNALHYIQLYKHPLIMIYASVDLSGIITSILSPSPPLPSRPERVPAPPASQPFNLVSPICMTGTKTYDLAGRTQMERLTVPAWVLAVFSQFPESLISPCGLH